MIGADGRATAVIDDHLDGLAGLERSALDGADMGEHEAEFLLRIGDAEQRAFCALDHAGIADLTAAFAVERCLRHDDHRRVALGQRLHGLAILQDRAHFGFGGFRRIAEELGGAGLFLDVEPDGFGGSFARTLPSLARVVLLLLHRFSEGCGIDRDVAPAQSVLRQIEREAVGVVKLERNVSCKHVACAQIVRGIVEQDQATLQGLAELGFLKLERLGDHCLRAAKFAVGVAHLADECWHEAVHQRVLGAEQMRMPHGAAHDPAQDIAAAFVGWQHAVGNQEAGCAQMVGDDPMARLLLAGRWHAGRVHRGVDQRFEQVGIVVRVDALEDRGDTFEAHARIDRGLWQVDALALSDLIELHEHEVPEFQETVAVLIGAAGRAALQFVALIDEYFRAWTAWARIARRPEVIRRVDADDLVVLEARDLLPQGDGFLIVVIDGDEQLILFDAEFFGDQGPGEADRLLFEIVPKREVAEHLEERVVARGVADVVEVVVLAAGAQAFLRRGRALVGSGLGAGEQVLELDHAGRREHQGRIVARHQRRGFHHLVAVSLVKAQEFGTDLVDAGHEQPCRKWRAHPIRRR